MKIHSAVHNWYKITKVHLNFPFQKRYFKFYFFLFFPSATTLLIKSRLDGLFASLGNSAVLTGEPSKFEKQNLTKGWYWNVIITNRWWSYFKRAFVQDIYLRFPGLNNPFYLCTYLTNLQTIAVYYYTDDISMKWPPHAQFSLLF